MITLPRAPRKYDPVHSDRVSLVLEQADRTNWKLTGDVSFNHTLKLPRIDPQDGAGLAFGEAASGFQQFHIGGAFTSDGSSNLASALHVDTDLTGAAGDTAVLAGALFTVNITTQGNADTIAVIAGVRIDEPNITDSGDTITAAASLHITAAPTEAASNYALWVDDGATRLDGVLTVGSAGPNAIGTAALSYVGLNIGGSFTSSGAVSRATGVQLGHDLIGAAGDTSRLELVAAGSSTGATITTQGNSDTISDVATMILSEPAITVGSGDTVTNASTLKILNAPTEGSNNYALWVLSGATLFGGNIGFYGTAPIAQQTGVAVSAAGIHAALVNLGLITA